MFFYVLFALALFLPRRKAVGAICIALTLYAFYGQSIPHLPGSLAYFAGPLLAEFAAGAVLGLAYSEGFRLPRPVAWGALLCGFAILACEAAGVLPEAGVTPRVLALGGPAALIVAGAVSIELKSPGTVWRRVALIGDASYALYLFHGVVLSMPRVQFPKFAVWAEHWPWLYVVFLVAAATAVAIPIHLLIERPMTECLRAMIERRRRSDRKMSNIIPPITASPE
jgi:peptidoglycan/LPS O-acetylase OafA/YrhL